MKLHDLAWRVLTNDQEVEQVDVRKVFCLFRIVFDPEPISVEKQAQIMRDYLDKIEYDHTLNNETWIGIKSLNHARIMYRL